MIEHWCKEHAKRLPCAKCEADARRYRFLRRIGHEQLNVLAHYAGEELDAAIDRAIVANRNLK